jgi:hypothetical protein
MSMLYLSGARLSISSTDVIRCDNGYNRRITVVVSTVFLLFSIIVAQQAVVGGPVGFNLLQSVLLRIADAVSLFFY